MAVVFLIGPPAVGKMTVGQELERLTGYRLFHNHVPIEVVSPYFSYGTPTGRRLVDKIRRAFFEEFAADSDGSYIFTFVLAFNVASEMPYIEGVAEQFSASGHEVFWVELEASFQERLKRNVTENRLAHKPTKRDVAWSDAHIRDVEGKHRFNSVDGEMSQANYLRIENTEVSAQEVAQRICDGFSLTKKVSGEGGAG